MYLKIDDYSIKIIRQVEEETLGDMGLDKNMLLIDEVNLISGYENLLNEIDDLKKQIEELKQPNDYNPELEIPDPRYE